MSEVTKFTLEYPHEDTVFLIRKNTWLTKLGLPYTSTYSMMINIDEIPDLISTLNEYANKTRDDIVQSTD